MADRLVADASPLIFLARIHGLEWLGRLSMGVIVPDAVLAELTAGGRGQELAAQLSGDSTFDVRPDVPVPAELSAWDVGPGETQVMAQGLVESDARLLLDDLAARRCAKALGLPVLGTLAVVVSARQRGWIRSARQAIQHLRASGMYLADALVEEVLAQVGE